MKTLAQNLKVGDTVKSNNRWYKIAKITQVQYKNGTLALCIYPELTPTMRPDFVFWFKNATTVNIK